MLRRKGISLIGISTNYWHSKYLIELDSKFDKLLKEGKLEIKENGEIIDMLTDYTANGSFKSLRENVEFVERGIPFVRIKNISENGLNLEDLKQISEKTYSYLKKSKLEGGELLFSKTGEKLGLAFVFPNDVGKYSLADNIFKVIYKKGIDCHYMSTFLNSKYGQLWTRRLSQGVAQPTIIKDRFRKIQVPIPSPEIQKYIGDKIRKAEELSKNAEELKNSCKNLLNKNLSAPKFTEKGISCEKVKEKSLFERIDADYYNTRYIDILKQLKSFGYKLLSIDEVCRSRIFNGKTLETENSKADTFNIGVGELGDWFPSKNELKSVKKKPDSKLLLPKEAIVWGNSAHLAKYIGSKTNMIMVDDVFVGTTEITAIVPDKQIISPYYLFLFMNSDWGYYQIQRTVKGMTAHSYPNDIKNIFIPNIEFKEEELSFLENTIKKVFKNQTDAEKLIQDAKQEVEDLIEGKFMLPMNKSVQV